MKAYKLGRFGLCVSVVLAAAVAAGGALADPFPKKPIKLVVPYRAGGGTDSLARMIQKAVEKNNLLPVPLTVVNVTGAGGTVGSRQVKDAKPDGYTILQIHQGMFAVSATDRVDYTPADFEPIIMTTQSCLYLGVKGDGPYKNFQDLVDAAKANPNKLKMADIIGGVSHFPAVMLMNATGAKFGVVQTGGTSKRFASIKGGFTQLAFFSPGWIKRGGNDLRGVLWLGPTRHPAAPDMPTAIELGYNVSACLNRRYWAPKGTPADHIKILADAIEAAVRTPELAAYHKKRLGSIVIQRGDVLRAAVKKEFAEFLAAAPTVKAAMGK